MKQKWSIRAYREGDEEGIFELDKAVHPSRVSDMEQWLKWWRWMYKDNPAGTGKIWLAEHDGRIVGQYAIVPVRVKIGSKVILSSQSLDTMTHPDYRRQGMFETLAKKVYDEARNEGIYLVYGFPNEFSYPGFIKKLNWFCIDTMQVMFKPLNWRNIIKLKVGNEFLQGIAAIGAGLVFNRVFFRTQKPPFVEGLTISQVTFFDERFNEFWIEICNQSPIIMVRNRDYLNWRYSTPNVSYSILVAEKDSKICGYLILRDRKDRIKKNVRLSYIFDIVAQSEEVMHCLVSRAVEHCRQNKVDLILYSFIESKTYHRVLSRNGFISVPFMERGRFCAYSSSPHISREFLTKRENWFVQIGDSDTT